MTWLKDAVRISTGPLPSCAQHQAEAEEFEPLLHLDDPATVHLRAGISVVSALMKQSSASLSRD